MPMTGRVAKAKVMATFPERADAKAHSTERSFDTSDSMTLRLQLMRSCVLAARLEPRPVLSAWDATHRLNDARLPGCRFRPVRSDLGG
jgi:hypothetical protein